MDMILTIISTVLGLVASIVAQYGIKKQDKKNSQDIDISERISIISNSLTTSATELTNIQNELEHKVAFVNNLKKEAEEAENIISLTKEQVSAIKRAINGELQSGNKKSFWSGVAVNFIFFVLGSAVSIIITLI